MKTRTTAQAWLQGGPVDGAVRPLECGPDGRPPALVMLRGGDLYISTSEQPEPGTYAIYELLAEQPSVGLWPYRHAGTLTG